MDEIIKLIETKPHYNDYYLIEERGKKEQIGKYIETISAKNATDGYLVIYDKESYMFTFKTIYKSSKGYYIKIKGKTVYLEDFKED
jgi:hypothetical protein